MMINKRLISMVSDSKKYIVRNVISQWVGLIANIVMMFTITRLLQKMYEKQVVTKDYVLTAVVFAVVIFIRFFCEKIAVRMSYLASRTVKKTLREKIYQKLLKIGAGYHRKVSSSEVVQVAVEGVDQLETYFGSYLPQFFYSMIAPLTLFIVLSFVNLLSAVVLLVCVPLIPITIALIQKWAKKLLSKYWGQYTALGDTFLENLQGLTTMKIYQTDAMKHKVMNVEAENFRKITMKVLTMQLNSITIMDLVTYGGTALGMILSVLQLKAGNITLEESLVIILLSADYFIPMRRLGSFFHIAMNGMAACDRIFRLLDVETGEEKQKIIGEDKTIALQNVSYVYEDAREALAHEQQREGVENKEVLNQINMCFPQNKFLALVGESGCGKSTIVGLLNGKNEGYTGSIQIGGVELSEIKEQSLMQNVTTVSHNCYLFKGTVRENLQMGNPKATDAEFLEALKKVQLYDFLMEEQGLDTLLMEKASNLSGGQCQRLAMARALLHDTPIYIFDEATSNIDVESEELIMEQVRELAKTKTVIMISHRLANVVAADEIYVLADALVAEHGTHGELLARQGVYAKMYQAQMELERFRMDA